MSQGLLDNIEQKYVAQTPAARLGNDEDLYGLILLLASQASDYMSGQAGSFAGLTQRKRTAMIVRRDYRSHIRRI